MNIYDPIAIALGIEPSIDISEYVFPKASDEPLPCPVKWTEDMRIECGNRQKELIREGKHYFSNNNLRNLEQLEKGIHPFSDPEAQRNRAKRPRKRSPKEYVSEANKDRMARGEHIQVSTITCPHCGKTGNYMVMKRWHFDKCKFR